ncbi:MAG TPA: flagellar basal body L-ring protein FlgH, partial [Spirochaetota bacterium]
MKRMIIIALVLSGCLSIASAASLWRDRNFYTAGQDVKVGDVVVVRVDDITRMRFNMTMNSKSDANVTSNPDVNITGFLPKIAADKKTTSSDSAALESKGDLALDIAAQLTARGNDGKFTIQGIKEYSFNGVASRFTVAGTLDPVLLAGRVIRSSDIVNFRLTVDTTKQGLGLNATRPPLQPNETPKA